MTKEKDVLVQTRVPLRVGKEITRHAKDSSISIASWLRKLLIDETASSLDGEFIDLNDRFIRKTSIIAMAWIDPHNGSCAEGREPWVLRLRLANPARKPDLLCGDHVSKCSLYASVAALQVLHILPGWYLRDSVKDSVIRP